nr:hypothetical protein [Amycolatopsis acidicola]
MGERVVGVAVLGLAQDRGLAAGQVGEDAFEAFALSAVLVGCSFVEPVEVGDEDFAALGAEDAVREEPGERVEEGGLAQIGCLGVSVMEIGSSAVVLLGCAHVVADVVPCGAGHSASAGAEDHAAQDVGLQGFGMGVEVVVGA